MSKTLKITLAQQNLLVGDIPGNAKKIIVIAEKARDELHADLVIFPELALTAYPPEDLLLRPDFQQLTKTYLQKIAESLQGIDVILGYPELTQNGLFNAAAVIQQQRISATYYKQQLPNYGVFDEKRYFQTGDKPCIIECKGVPIGITICEDLWYPGPIQQAKAAGAQLICSLNASPYDITKSSLRSQILQQRINETRLPIIYTQAVGAQDELVFDGGSMVLDDRGYICDQAPYFSEALLPIEINIQPNLLTIYKKPLPAVLSSEASIYQALILGLKDYVEKNHFPGVIIGLSGGIDSALTLTLAVDALGAERVHAVMLPSRYTSELSLNLAKTQAEQLKVKYQTISIEPAFKTLLNTLEHQLTSPPNEIVQQNLQARCRANLLMAISNQTGYLVLTTSNKSETAVGYTTLYGDMAGGFAVLKDVYKTLIYRLAAYRNNISTTIPQAVIDRPPTAELAHQQLDVDTLPPYPVLDQILELYVEKDFSIEDILAQGYAPDMVRQVLKLVNRNEYKRRQAAPGIKITPRAFGRDRRYPITSGFSCDYK